MPRYLVQVDVARAEQVKSALRGVAATIITQVFDYVTIDIPEELVPRVRAMPGVVQVTPERAVRIAAVPVFQKLQKFMELARNPLTFPLALAFSIQADIEKVRWPTNESRKVLGADEAEAEGYCLTEDCMVAINNGMKPISEVEQGDLVYSLDLPNMDIKTNKVLKKLRSGRQKIYEVRTHTRRIKCTANHPLLVFEKVTDDSYKGQLKWKKVSELTVKKDLIAIIKALPNNGKPYKLPEIESEKTPFNKTLKPLKTPRYTTPNLMRVFGFWVGDGTLHREREVGFACKDGNSLKEKCALLIEENLGKIRIDKKGIYVDSTLLVKRFEKLGLCGQSSERELPSWIFTLPTEQKRAFLEGYMDADAHRRKGLVYFEARSEKLIRQLRDLAISAGFLVSNLWQRGRVSQLPQGGSKESVMWCFHIRTPYQNHRRIYGYKYRGCPESEYVAFDKVKSIRQLGEEEVYDLSIENTHNFFAEGIVVHNSGKGVKVAVLDTGGDPTCLQMPGIRGISSVDGQPLFFDENGHSTHVYTTIAGSEIPTPWGRVKGVAPDAEIGIFKVLGYGLGAGTETFVMRGLMDAFEWGADIISMSLGSPYTEEPTEKIPECVPPSTIVSGDYCPIFELQSGTRCLGVSGHVKILQKFKRFYKGKLITVKGRGLLPLNLTPEHPVLVVTGKTDFHHIHDEGRRTSKVRLTDPYWKRAEEIVPKKGGEEGEYLLVPKLKGEIDIIELSLLPYTTKAGLKIAKSKKKGDIPLTLPLNRETAWLLGVFVAEGYPNTTKGEVDFCLGKYEVGLTEQLRNIIWRVGYSPSVRELRTAQVVRVYSRMLSRALKDWCGCKAENKHIPSFILYHKSRDIVEGFLEGYLTGDGRTKGGGAKTSSMTLALQLQLLLVGLGRLAKITTIKAREDVSIEDRTVQEGDSYEIRWTDSEWHRGAVLENYAAYPVKSIEYMRYEGEVYNLETEDATYLASNIVVHNCRAIKMLTEQGIICVVANGNEGPDPRTVGVPACSPYALSIGAVDRNGNLADFSSKGPTQEGLIKPDCVAPGVDILSSTCGMIAAMQFMDGFKLGAISGTSMATPHISGLVALIKQLYRENGVELTTPMLKDMLERYGWPKNAERGWGPLSWDMAKKYLTEVLA